MNIKSKIIKIKIGVTHEFYLGIEFC